MLPGDSVPDLTVLVGNGEDVVVLTAVGSTPLAQHQAATDSVVSSVVSRFQAGRPLRPEGGRFVDRGANNRVARVVVMQQQERGDFADNLLDARPAGGALGLVGLGVQSLAPGRNQEVVASAGPRGVARVRTVDGEIAVNPDTVAVVNMRRRSANYFDLDAFLRELRLGMYAQPGRQEERR